MLQQRLSKYEKPEKQIRLLDNEGNPTDKYKQYETRHPFAKRGPSSVLETLPNAFDEAQLESLRVSRGMSKEGTKNQLYKWIFRKYITYDSHTGIYTKTEKYIKRIEQTKLVDITDENIISIIDK